MGEARLGLLDGVIETKPGWLDGIEVVEVTFDPEALPFELLLERAKALDCATRVTTRSEAQQEVAASALGMRARRSDAAIRVDDDKYYLSRTPLRFVPMTPMQATLANERVGTKQSVDALLSPRQRALLETVEAHPDAGWEKAIGRPLSEAWTAAAAKAAACTAPDARD